MNDQVPMEVAAAVIRTAVLADLRVRVVALQEQAVGREYKYAIEDVLELIDGGPK